MALRIIFLGTPDFAAYALDKLVESSANVVAVVTMPDKPVGRHGNTLQPSAVKEMALKHNLPVLQPENLKAPEFIEELRSYNADLQIVVAFRMLPESVWNMPRLGTFNLHASLLPRYRGAAPINWALINGEKETGVTTFFLKHEIDTGNIIMQRTVAIMPQDNFETLHDKLMLVGSDVIIETLALIEKGIDPSALRSQDDMIAAGIEPAPAPKIFKETRLIDWNRSAWQIHNFVRGLAPYPAAYAVMHFDNGAEQEIKILATAVVDSATGVAGAAGSGSAGVVVDSAGVAGSAGSGSAGSGSATVAASVSAGTIVTNYRNYMYVATGNGWISILSLQPAGKKTMDIKAFLCGFKAENARF